MEARFQDQLARIDRLLALVGAADPANDAGPLTYHDLLVVTCEAMWILKDWLLEDPALHARSRDALREDIHGAWCLLTCSDIACGRAQLVLTRPATFAAAPARARSPHLRAPAYYVSASDVRDPFHGMEIDVLFAECQLAWRRIIDKHWLSDLPF